MNHSRIQTYFKVYTLYSFSKGLFSRRSMDFYNFFPGLHQPLEFQGNKDQLSDKHKARLGFKGAALFCFIHGIKIIPSYQTARLFARIKQYGRYKPLSLQTPQLKKKKKKSSEVMYLKIQHFIWSVRGEARCESGPGEGSGGGGGVSARLRALQHPPEGTSRLRGRSPSSASSTAPHKGPGAVGPGSGVV